MQEEEQRLSGVWERVMCEMYVTPLKMQKLFSRDPTFSYSRYRQSKPNLLEATTHLIYLI
jgi:hypothetical protein